MTLDSLQLLFFKNYEAATLQFTPGLNCFIGDNGSGKTNLLDAIHYLSLTKSALTAVDANSIKQGADFFVVKGKFSTDESADAETIQVSLRQGQKKTLTHDKQPYERMADHIGRYPAVLVSPYDTDLIREGSEERRKYFDSLLSQFDHGFLDVLISYNALLRQRNALLKQAAERPTHGFDHDYLLAIDDQLVPLGTELSQQRTTFLERFTPIFQHHYQQLADGREEVSLTYKSQLLETDFGQLLRQNERRDLVMQRTTTGAHRDDFVFLMDGLPVKSYASQGQQKSYAIALKLAQFETLTTRLAAAGTAAAKPLLLLDDIFDRLDDKRIARLLELVADDTFGQVFLTDTNLARTDQALANVRGDIRRFRVQGGTAVQL
ncbi:DNA replication/repair protein RecF [Hymenobacter sp. PAMC 26628]|uniref:DNA replication/repair protein RecF n=1 Tax=Hymenobacter sp. PAMC 26628 TaxID=1484118 RepID=UPI000770502F|nr:DNA replication/repair protein RecF [Hymenobacter sp. PAMC 26628]AMJ67630.1 DNA recombination protein RecF [Hymenobacter sp. PAMC 26628]